MKKIVCTMLCIMLLFGLSACGGDVSEVKLIMLNLRAIQKRILKPLLTQ